MSKKTKSKDVGDPARKHSIDEVQPEPVSIFYVDELPAEEAQAVVDSIIGRNERPRSLPLGRHNH